MDADGVNNTKGEDMKLSMKSRYAFRALADLAMNSKTVHIPLNVLAERNGISPQFLEQVFASLRRAGIVKSVKGPQGGYYLARPASVITASDIIHAIDGSYDIPDEKTADPCKDEEISEVIQELIIDPLNEQMGKILESVTLEDMEEQYIKRSMKIQYMYYI